MIEGKGNCAIGRKSRRDGQGDVHIATTVQIDGQCRRTGAEAYVVITAITCNRPPCLPYYYR